MRNLFLVAFMGSAKSGVERTTDSADRPLLNIADREKKIGKLFADCQQKYQASTDIIIDTNNRSVNGVVEEVLGETKGFRDEAR